MSAIQIKKAQKLLEQVTEAKTLIDKHNNARGKVAREFTGSIVLEIKCGQGVECFSLETLEKWIKQAKVVARKGYV